MYISQINDVVYDKQLYKVLIFIPNINYVTNDWPKQNHNCIQFFVIQEYKFDKCRNRKGKLIFT